MAKGSFVSLIDLNLSEKLKTDLIDQGFEISQPPYTLFSGKKPGISCTLYASGKLMVQGKNMEDFITFYLEPEILKTLAYSHPETFIETHSHIGIDEAGKGDFFGPLCIAGVYADEEGIKTLIKMGVADSKRMSDKKMVPLAAKIKGEFPFSIVQIGPQKYNELYKKFGNLNRLLAWGHATAITELVEKTGCGVVTIDQFGGPHLVENALKQKGTQVELTQRHYGESDPVVAAASVLARIAFVTGIEKLGESVGMELPKGASSLVTDAGKRLVARKGPEILELVGKSHFKTKGVILGDAS